MTLFGAMNEAMQESRPLPGHEAFGRTDPVAVRSQAAFLLVLARRLRSDRTGPDDVVVGDPEDEEPLDIPEWSDSTDSELALARRHWSERRASDSAALPPVEASAIASSALALYDRPSADAAADLMQACLAAPHPLVRVAAAAADLHLHLQAEDLALMMDELPGAAGSPYVREPRFRATAGFGIRADRRERLFPLPRLPVPGRATDVLIRGAGDQDELVRDMAVSALEGAWFHHENRTTPGLGSEEPSDDWGRGRTGSPPAPNERPDRRFSIVVHGTFARRADWWRPGRAFPKFLRVHVTPNLYAGRRPFSWPGLYSHRARELGASDLAEWASKHGPLDHVFAYSHGGSVAMMASQRGVQMNKLVLLSCPVRRAYTPSFDRIGRVVSVRTRLDLVILVDFLVAGGRQRFRDSRIDEHVLPLWFSHEATRQPDVWQRHDIAAMI